MRKCGSDKVRRLSHHVPDSVDALWKVSRRGALPDGTDLTKIGESRMNCCQEVICWHLDGHSMVEELTD